MRKYKACYFGGALMLAIAASPASLSPANAETRVIGSREGFHDSAAAAQPSMLSSFIVWLTGDSDG